MLNQDLANVLLILFAANVIAVIVFQIVPRIRAARHERARARRAEFAANAQGELTVAGRPWFFDAAPDAGELATSDTPELATPDAAIDEGEAAPWGDDGDDESAGFGADTAWAGWLEAESMRIARYRRPATIVLVELSGLDRLADRIGRAAAERLIPPVAETISRHARAADRIARLGTTRFGILLVETDEVSAINYVERIRSACDLWLAAGAVAVRLSIGWSEINPERPAGRAFADAEDRLFEERRRSGPGAVSDAGEAAEPVLHAMG